MDRRAVRRAEEAAERAEEPAERIQARRVAEAHARDESRQIDTEKREGGRGPRAHDGGLVQVLRVRFQLRPDPRQNRRFQLRPPVRSSRGFRRFLEPLPRVEPSRR